MGWDVETTFLTNINKVVQLFWKDQFLVAQDIGRTKSFVDVICCKILFLTWILHFLKNDFLNSRTSLRLSTKAQLVPSCHPIEALLKNASLKAKPFDISMLENWPFLNSELRVTRERIFKSTSSVSFFPFYKYSMIDLGFLNAKEFNLLLFYYSKGFSTNKY